MLYYETSIFHFQCLFYQNFNFLICHHDCIRMASVISKMGFLFLEQGFSPLLVPICIAISICCSGTGFFYQVVSLLQHRYFLFTKERTDLCIGYTSFLATTLWRLILFVVCSRHEVWNMGGQLWYQHAQQWHRSCQEYLLVCLHWVKGCHPLQVHDLRFFWDGEFKNKGLTKSVECNWKSDKSMVFAGFWSWLVLFFWWAPRDWLDTFHGVSAK